MNRLTQTNLDPGNCWQTCVACILDVDPSGLPDQALYDLRNPDGSWRGPSYLNALQGYLHKHHGLSYVTVYAPALRHLRVATEGGLHLMCGPTIRTAHNGGVNHAVVARDGSLEWDPHPSRAGLLSVSDWGLIVPTPPEWEKAGRPACECHRCKESG